LNQQAQHTPAVAQLRSIPGVGPPHGGSGGRVRG
jgi:hypothetical protein